MASRRSTKRVLLAIFLLLSCWTIIALLLPNFQRPNPATRRSECRYNLKQIAIALHYYHDTYGSFPLAYMVDSNGTPMHSWRVLILPFLDQGPLYDRYDFSEPWNGSNNRKLGRALKLFNCPSTHIGENPSPSTNYLAIVGPRTAWLGAEPIKLKQMTDGWGQVIQVVEVANSGIHWMEPRDLHILQMPPQINAPAGQGPSSNHKGGAQVLFADGFVRFLRNDLSAEDFKAMLTIDGGESVDVDAQ